MSARVLPKGWREVTLGSLGQIFDGPHATPTRGDEGAYFLNIASLDAGRLDLSKSDRVSKEDFATWTRRVQPMSGDLLFSYETRLGAAALMPSGVQACLGRRMALLRPDRRVVDPTFLLYAYLSPYFQALIEERTVHGATVDRIPLNAMSAWLMRLPDLSEQRAIAEVLGALDDKIAANARLVEASSAVALALASQASTFVRVGEVAVHARSQVTPADMKAEVVHHYSLPAFDAASGPDIVAPGEIKSSKFLVIKPSVLVSKLNPRFPRIWDVSVLDEFDALASTEFVVLEPHGISSSLLWALIAQPAVSVELEAQVAGTSGSHQRVKPEAILAARIGNPSTLSEEVRDGIESCTSRAHAVRRETSKLIATRDALLPALMSGRLTVRDAEAVAAGAGL